LIKQSDFTSIRKLRNTFVFHYNYRDNSLDTQKALEALLEKAQQCPSGSENLIVRTANPLTSRFFVADELAIAGWKLIVGLPQCFDSSHPGQKTTTNSSANCYLHLFNILKLCCLLGLQRINCRVSRSSFGQLGNKKQFKPQTYLVVPGFWKTPIE
jgi:hypothetical protein